MANAHAEELGVQTVPSPNIVHTQEGGYMHADKAAAAGYKVCFEVLTSLLTSAVLVKGMCDNMHAVEAAAAGAILIVAASSDYCYLAMVRCLAFCLRSGCNRLSGSMNRTT